MHYMPHKVTSQHHKLELALHLADRERAVEAVRAREDEQARGARGEEGRGEAAEPAYNGEGG